VPVEVVATGNIQVLARLFRTACRMGARQPTSAAQWGRQQQRGHDEDEYKTVHL